MNKHILLICFLSFIVYIFYSYKEIEPFESSIYNNMKSKYKQTKRKALMIKDGFTGNLGHKVKKFVRIYKL
jgi:hypothetical protein